MSKPLQQRTFNNINRYIKELVKDKHYKAEEVAGIVGVSVSTVRMIKRTKTWPKYQEALSRRKKTVKATTDEKLARDLKKIEDEPTDYVTLKQFNDAVAELSGNISNAKTLAKIANGKANDAVKTSDEAKKHAKSAADQEQQNSGFLRAIMQRKPGWFRRVHVETPDR